MTPNTCPVCLSAHLRPAQVVFDGDAYHVDCPLCGRFYLEEQAWADFLNPQSGAGHKLTALCRARLAHRIQIASSPDSSNPPMLNSEFVCRFVNDGCPGPTPAEQATSLITFIGDQVSRSGRKIDALPEHLFTIVGAPNPELAGELAIELKNNGLLVGIGRKPMGVPPNLLNVNLTLEGWRRYEEEKRGQIAGKYGFIAMEFDDAALEEFVATVVKPAVKTGIGYDLFDMRDVARAGIIDNIMRAQIRDSAFVIVDLTHDNSGAYWEAGYAEGLGKPVVYICERSKFDEAKTHFDTNHCTSVLWSAGDPRDFDRELTATLRRSLICFQRLHKSRSQAVAG